MAAQVNGGTEESFDEPAISADGSRLAFSGSSGQVYASIDGSGRILSRSASGAPGNGPSGKAQLPGTGSRAFFHSAATNLLPGGDGNGSVSDVYSVDLATGSVTLISRGPNGEPANGPSFAPWASDDGQTIAFSSRATNIVPDDPELPGSARNGSFLQATMMRGGGFGQSRLYLSRNLQTGELGNGDSLNVRLTPDGRAGVFESQASNLVAGDGNRVSDIFRFEIEDNRMVKLERISVSRYGFEGNGASRNPSISDDGEFVTFETEASNLVELDRNGTSDILVKWIVTGDIVRLSRTIDGEEPNGASQQPAISGDGGTVVFGSQASNLAENDGNGVEDVFRVNLRERAPAIIEGPLDEPSIQGFALPSPNPPNANCPAGFFIATVEDGPGAGLTPGVFGMELLLDEPGTRLLAGGLNFGGLVDVAQPGFAGFNFANPANEPQRLNLRVNGSPSNDAQGQLPVTIRIERRPDANSSVTVFETNASLSLAQAFTSSVDLPPGFYAVTVSTSAGNAGGAADGQFFFELATSFLDRPGGGFQGGAVVGGYHAEHPFGGVSGFAAFCIATPHATSMRALSAPTYGPSGARDLRLRLLDAQQRSLLVVPVD